MAKSVLARAGISSSVVSVDPTVTRRGCSFGVSISCADRNRAELSLKRARIQYGDILGGS